MSATQTFAIDASQRLPDPALHGEGDIVSIIELLIPVIIPLIESCFQDTTPARFGAGCCSLATDALNNPWKRLAFRIGVRRELGRREYRDLPGGGHDFCLALIEQAAASTPQQLDAVHTECCCC